MITYEDLFIEINNKLYIHKNIYICIYINGTNTSKGRFRMEI